MKVVLLQYDIAWEDPVANYRTITDKILTQEGDIFVLPEMWATGFSMNTKVVGEKIEDSLSIKLMEVWAETKNALFIGSLPILKNGKFYNIWFAVDKNGIQHQYEKKHLFAYGKEANHYEAGLSRSVFEYQSWRIMPFVCYDLRFPVWMRNDSNIDLYIGVANWPESRIDAWISLLKARAIENQAYVVGVNRTGSEPSGLSYNGRSAVYNYVGETMCILDTESQLYIVELDKDKLNSFRSEFPFLKDRDGFQFDQ